MGIENRASEAWGDFAVLGAFPECSDPAWSAITDPVTVMILYRGDAQARIGSAAAAFFPEREDDCEACRVTRPPKSSCW
jgi:hypothetical protein